MKHQIMGTADIVAAFGGESSEAEVILRREQLSKVESALIRKRAEGLAKGSRAIISLSFEELLEETEYRVDQTIRF